jgi:hypothetical protein
MKRQILGVITGSVLATALVAAQGAQTPPPAAAPQGDKMKDVTVTGCLVQGSAPAIFLLEDAKLNPEDKNEKGKKYFVTAAVPDLKANLNKEVRIIGQAETKEPPTPPAGQKVAEGDLPKLAVKTISAVADRCTSIQ